MLKRTQSTFPFALIFPFWSRKVTLNVAFISFYAIVIQMYFAFKRVKMGHRIKTGKRITREGKMWLMKPCHQIGRLLRLPWKLAKGGLIPTKGGIAAMIAGIQKKDDFADFETVDEQ